MIIIFYLVKQTKQKTPDEFTFSFYMCVKKNYVLSIKNVMTDEWDCFDF